MNLKLHANATTTPRTRAYIRVSPASNSELARELGVSTRTVARWKARSDTADRSHRPHRLSTTITDCKENLIVELRRTLALPLDDIVEAMRRCVNPALSRSAVRRCLKRHQLSARIEPDKQPPSPSRPKPLPASSISISNICHRSIAGALMLMSPSTVPPASSTLRYCQTEAQPPPPASCSASSKAFRSSTHFSS
jgi:transposase